MRQFIPILAFLSFTQLTFLTAQSCLPLGIVFESQGQIDSFSINYPGCTEIEGDVQIYGPGILDLSGLSTLSLIGGDLSVNSTALLNFQGLENLQTVQGDFFVQYNQSMLNLSGLENLASVGMGGANLGQYGLYLEENVLLTNLEALESLQKLSSLHVWSNPGLVDFSGLEQIDSLPGCLQIGAFNFSLSSLAGLEGLTYIGSCNGINYPIGVIELPAGPIGLVIVGMSFFPEPPSMEDLNGLNNLEHIEGSVVLFENDYITSLNGLNNLKSIGGSLHLGVMTYDSYGYPFISGTSIQELNGLENLQSIGKGLYLIGNYYLSNLQGLNNLETISENDPNADVEIINNDNLFSLEGLDKLDTIPGLLRIGAWSYSQPWIGNDILNGLNGLSSLTYIHKLSITNNQAMNSLNGLNDSLRFGSAVNISLNESLILCHNIPICRFIDEGGSVNVSGNAAGCNSVEELETGCLTVSTSDIGLVETIEVYPIPADDRILISGVNPYDWDVKLLDSFGRVIPNGGILSDGSMDISGMPAGWYLIQFNSKRETVVKKIIVY